MLLSLKSWIKKSVNSATLLPNAGLYADTSYQYEGVNPDYGWWGFIAEELVEVDPRLVVFDENQEPIAINYDRAIPHIVMELKKKRQEVKDLQELVGNLVSRIEALESSNT